MKRDFKVGDRVKILKHDTYEEVVGLSGNIVSIDSDGDFLIKLDEDVDTYDYCFFNKYKSDKSDLINIEIERGHKIELI